MTLVVTYSALSDIGLCRKTNEDAFVVAPPLFAVCDGMGGALAGEVASGLAAATLEAKVAEGIPLAAAAEAANAAVYARGREDSAHAGMGTTLTAVLIENDVAHFVHIGDSRAYLLRGGELAQVSDDHSLVAEMVRDGRLSEAEAAVHPHRSILSRALGTEPSAKIDEFVVDLEADDVLLLCSDGLSGPVGAAAIAAALGADDVDEAAARLIREAQRHGGPDNITAVVLRFAEKPPAPTPAPVETTAGSGEDDAGVIPPLPEDGGDAIDQGADQVAADDDPAAGPDTDNARRRRRRWGWLAGTLAVLVVLAAAGAVILSNVFFVSVDEEHLAIYSGLPVEVGPVPLHAVYRTSSRAYTSLSEEEQALVDARELHSQDGAMELASSLGMWP